MIPRCMSFLAWIPEFEDKFDWPLIYMITTIGEGVVLFVFLFEEEGEVAISRDRED